MLVILNSDILYSQTLLTSLTLPVLRLIDACSRQGHTVVIPETSKLEFDRKQGELVDNAKNELESAYATLARFEVSYEHRSPAEVIAPPDLLALIANNGAVAKIVEPTLEDYREAHRRASLHLEPHPPGDTKSDEMRDLIIWMTALRLARECDGALLVSRDVVHTHSRGDVEADEAGLMRVKTIDDALEFLDVQTPAGQLFRQLMEPAWPLLASEGLPITPTPVVRSVARPVFEQGLEGLASASCTLKVTTEAGGILRCRAEVEISAEHQQVTVRNVVADGGPYPQSISVQTDPVFGPTAESKEHLSRLRQILEDGS